MLANIKGAFSESEIGSIALQLLTQVKQMHGIGMCLYQLAPQMVLVKDGFKRGSQIKVQLSHLASMVFSQTLH